MVDRESNRLGVIHMIKNFLRDESGASAAEYALILAVVGAAIAAAAFALGGAVKTSIDGATKEVKDCTVGSATACGTTTA